MFENFYLRQIIIVLLMYFGVTNNCKAQNSSFELWPETDIWYRFNPSWRLSSFIPITKNNESQGRDINVYVNVDYSWGRGNGFFITRLADQEATQILKAWMIRAGVMEGWNLGSSSSDYSEDMILAELHHRTPVKGRILLSHRFRTETRWLGEDDEFSYRFRYRFMTEKEFRTVKNSIVPYVNAEAYWDSRYSKVSRFRAIGGVTTTLGSKYALETNLTYQYDETYSTQNLYAVNLIFHVYLEKNKKKEQ